MSEKYIEQFEYKLLAPVDYTFEGGARKAEKLIIKAPNNKVSQLTSIIEKEFSSAMLEIQLMFAEKMSDSKKEAASKKAEASEADQDDTVLTLLFAKGDVDKCLAALQQILIYEKGGKAMCYVDGVTNMTKPIFEELSYRDTKLLLAKYIENFISSSLSS